MKVIPIVAVLLAIGCEQPQTPDIAQDALQQVDTSVQPSEPVTSPDAGTADTGAVVPLLKVVGIVDGDTIDVLTPENETKRLRLNAIDCPERGQPFGNNATQFLRGTIGGQMVRIVEYDQDRYGRTIADVYLDDANINRELVKRGLAWHYKQHSDDERLAADEVEARTGQVGLWSDPRHVAPWDWRKLSKAERDDLR